MSSSVGFLNIYGLIHITIACQNEIFAVAIRIKWDGGVFASVMLCSNLGWNSWMWFMQPATEKSYNLGWNSRVCVMQPATEESYKAPHL